MMIQPPTWWWGEDSETGNKPGEANRLVWPTLMNRWPRRGSRESVEKERETPDSGAFVVLWKSLDSPGEEEKRRGETKRRRESTTRNYSSVGDKSEEERPGRVGPTRAPQLTHHPHHSFETRWLH
ncbi:unnamed protein product [Bursaphelenchus xylophilus]|uniref:(pine wood nematode) hypothetical protein n=1 Tax=Bursaphelenchus xylophilus TaxID=6326 RepID=A0A7I8WSX0_BURXY|nr:unnamed protein product [Bursaphelenchus xylophilus]CAG9115780.1 unnamed protein product [Bursaphelenchus xylophilus]